MTETGGSASYTSFDSSSNTTQQESSPLRTSTVRARRNPIKECLDPQDGLRIIIISFVVFSLALTVALVMQITYGSPQIEPHFAVATDYRNCSEIGVNIMKGGGSAVDAAIASILCLSVVHPHVTGLGSGGYMLIHDHRRNSTSCLNFREIAPGPANETIAVNSDLGTLVGVPGLLKGLEVAHKQYGGKLKWNKLVEPAITLGRQGYQVSPFLADALKNKLSPGQKESEDLLKMFTDADGKLVANGSLVRNQQLLETLQVIAKEGSSAFYKGSIGKNIVSAVNDAGGQMSASDLESYSVIEEDCIPFDFGDYRVWVPPAPSGGSLAVNILNILDGYSLQKDANSWATILKASALALNEENGLVPSSCRGSDATCQNAESYNDFALSESFPEDYISALAKDAPPLKINFPVRHQTAASVVAVMDNDDLYVSLVSGLGDWFGSGLVTNGFILNSAVGNFLNETPDDSMFYSEGQKRPPTMITPVVIEDRTQVCKKRLVSGAGDAEGMVSVLLNYLVYMKSFADSIDDPRIHLGEETNVFIENDHNRTIPKNILKKLKDIGYNENSMKPPYSSINAIEKYMDGLRAHSDSRGGGVGSRYG